MFENPTGRIIRCPECFAKDIDVFLQYDEEDDEFYCYKCCFTGNLDKVNERMKAFIHSKYPKRSQKVVKKEEYSDASVRYVN